MIIGVRIERELKEKLSKAAKDQHRSLSGQAVLFIELGVKHLERMAVSAALPNTPSGVKHPTRKGAAK